MGDESLKIAVHIDQILKELGYDNSDPHFKRTGDRVARWLVDFYKNGTSEHVAQLLEVVFPEDVPETLVIVGPTEYRSMCAHHMLPVVGKAWVGYLPSEGICGLSKLSRLVEYFASQLTVQERVTQQIADAIDTHLNPLGCMVVVQAEHGCMSFRGIRNNDVSTVTSAVRGVHKESAAARNEFLSLMKGFHR